MILIIDFSERKKIEEINISKIAKICTKQSSNWEQNREFIDAKMIELYELDFISRNELTAVTGILPGGANGNLKNKDGTRKTPVPLILMNVLSSNLHPMFILF